MYGMRGTGSFRWTYAGSSGATSLPQNLSGGCLSCSRFGKGGCCWAPNRFLNILRLPLRLRSGLAAKAGMHSTSSAFRGTAQTPYKRLNFGSGPSTALRDPTRGARLRLSQTPAKRLNFAKRVGDGDQRCTLGEEDHFSSQGQIPSGRRPWNPTLQKRRLGHTTAAHAVVNVSRLRTCMLGKRGLSAKGLQIDVAIPG